MRETIVAPLVNSHRRGGWRAWTKNWGILENEEFRRFFQRERESEVGTSHRCTTGYEEGGWCNVHSAHVCRHTRLAHVWDFHSPVPTSRTWCRPPPPSPSGCQWLGWLREYSSSVTTTPTTTEENRLPSRHRGSYRGVGDLTEPSEPRWNETRKIQRVCFLSFSVAFHLPRLLKEDLKRSSVDIWSCYIAREYICIYIDIYV